MILNGIEYIDVKEIDTDNLDLVNTVTYMTSLDTTNENFKSNNINNDKIVAFIHEIDQIFYAIEKKNKKY